MFISADLDFGISGKRGKRVRKGKIPLYAQRFLNVHKIGNNQPVKKRGGG